MMNTIEYIKERNRMCKSYEDECKGCPAFNAYDDDLFCVVGNESTLDAMEQIAIVKKWSIEHPMKQKKTRQDIFLEQYPEADIDDNGAISICPMCVSASYRDKNGCRTPIDCECADCCRKFWMAEVKEDK